MNKSLLYLMLVTNSAWGVSWLAHDRAVYAAQKGDWQKSAQLLSQKLIDAPHDATLLYDAGVAAYKTGVHEQARSYFERAVQEKSASSLVREHAYFNLGNAHVALHQLKEAVGAYEHALQIDPHDEHARHNLEKVKEMLRKEEEQKKNQQDKKDEKKQERDEQKNEQQNDEQKENESSQKQSEQQQKKQEQTKDDKQQSGRQDEKRDQRSGAPEQKKQQGGREQEDKAAPQSGKQNEQKQQQREKAAKGQQREQEKKHAQSTEESAKSGTPKEGSVHGTQQEGKDDPTERLDASLKRLLNAQEKEDERNNKAFIRAAAGAPVAGADEQHCR